MVLYIIGLLLTGILPYQASNDAPKHSISANQTQSIYGLTNKQLSADESGRNLVVVLDPGHGGKDTGCSGHSHLEKDVTLEFTKALGAKLEQQNPYLTIYYTRTGDESVSLNQRINLANRVKADIFLSIHANAGPSDEVSGFETFVYGENLDDQHHHLTQRENALPDSHPKKASPIASLILAHMHQDQLLDKSIRLASKIDRQVAQLDHYRNRGIKQAQFRVLHKAQMPSVLLEIGYLTSQSDIAKLADNRFKSNLLSKISTGVMDFLENLEKA